VFDIQSWALSVLLPLTALTLLFVLLLPWLSRRCSARSLYAALLILLVAFLIPVRPAFLRIRLPQATYTAPAPIAAPQPIGVPGGVTMQPIPATNDSLSPEPTRSAVRPALHTPMVAGLVRPRILLPDEKLSTSELHFVFRHELTHVKRRDLWVKALQGLALCLHWWNPAMHLLHRALQIQCESACDEALLRGASLPTRQFYSETILSVIRRQPHAAPIVSTGFYGGKKGMKKRITNILDMGHKRYGALLLAAVLLMSSLGVLAASDSAPDNAPSSPTAERQATKGYLTSPHGMIHVTGIPTDYDYPQMVYFSGVPVLMDELIHKETQFGFEDWIHISVPAGADETVMAGYTLLSNFVSAAEAPDSFYPFPTVTLNGDSITGTASLYLNNGLTNDVLGSYPNGTELTVLGFTRTHYQVLLDGHQGFVPRENARMEGEGKSRITGAEPAHYDSHTPGREADYEAMNRRFQELTDTYGDINEWSIPMRARWSQEQIEADTLSDSPDIWVHLMPGQDDLTEEAARALADKALAEKDARPRCISGCTFLLLCAQWRARQAPVAVLLPGRP
jgi:beta-lactamase regulating signal transducer with metallopeptidase domain